MPTAPGTASSKGNGIIANCVIDDAMYTFLAKIDTPIEPFPSNAAKIEYATVDDLKSARSFTGTIGTSSFSLAFDNGVKISGELKAPVHYTTSVAASGEWAQIS